MPSDARWHYKAAHFLTCKSISLQLPALQKNIMTNTANSSHCAFSEETATFLWKNSPLLELGAKCVKRMGKLELESLKNTQEHRQIALTSPISQMRCRLREAFDGERSMNKKIIISARGKETPRREWEKRRERKAEREEERTVVARSALRSHCAGAACSEVCAQAQRKIPARSGPGLRTSEGGMTGWSVTTSLRMRGCIEPAYSGQWQTWLFTWWIRGNAIGTHWKWNYGRLKTTKLPQRRKQHVHFCMSHG